MATKKISDWEKKVHKTAQTYKAKLKSIMSAYYRDVKRRKITSTADRNKLWKERYERQWNKIYDSLSKALLSLYK